MVVRTSVQWNPYIVGVLLSPVGHQLVGLPLRAVTPSIQTGAALVARIASCSFDGDFKLRKRGNP